MLLYELLQFLNKKVGKKNVLVVSSDRLSQRLELPVGIIANLSRSNESGSHWVAIHIDESSKASFFCSFGQKPRVKSIQIFLRKHGKTIKYNTQQLQNFNSRECGKYCAVYLYHVMKLGERMENFLKRFSLHNTMLNDLQIAKLYRRLDI